MTDDQDAYAWVLRQAELAARGSREQLDVDGLQVFLEEAAEEMVSAVRSQLVALMAHAAAAAVDPERAGPWRSACEEAYDRIVEAYRPSMRGAIHMDSLWRRACRKAAALLADRSELARIPLAIGPRASPITLDELLDPELDVEALVGRLRAIGTRGTPVKHVRNLVQLAGGRADAREAMRGVDPKATLVELDFDGVVEAAPSFGDEIWRVWASEHPTVEVVAVNVSAGLEPWLRGGGATISGYTQTSLDVLRGIEVIKRPDHNIGGGPARPPGVYPPDDDPVTKRRP